VCPAAPPSHTHTHTHTHTHRCIYTNLLPSASFAPFPSLCPSGLPLFSSTWLSQGCVCLCAFVCVPSPPTGFSLSPFFFTSLSLPPLPPCFSPLCCYASREWFNNSAAFFPLTPRLFLNTTVTHDIDSHVLTIPTRTHKNTHTQIMSHKNSSKHPQTHTHTLTSLDWLHSNTEKNTTLQLSPFVVLCLFGELFSTFFFAVFFFSFSSHLFTIVKINLSLQGFTFDIYKCNV